MKRYLIFDEHGFYVEDAINDYTLLEGQQVLEVPLDKVIAFHKPKLVGGEVVEGATQEEIDEANKPVPQPPTETERLKNEVSTLNQIVLELTELILGGMN